MPEPISKEPKNIRIPEEIPIPPEMAPKPLPEKGLLKYKHIISSAMAHALVASGLGYLDEQRVQHITGPETEEAAEGPSAKEMVREWKEIERHNEGVIEQLKAEQEAYITHTIDLHLDPDSPDYLGNNPEYIQPQESVYFMLDAYRAVLETAAKERDKRLELHELKSKVSEYADHLQKEYDKRLEKIIDNKHLIWTGDPLIDFSTYQKAAFVGEDRFFENSSYTQTVYLKASDRFDEQIYNGLVNCSVARATPEILEDIYKAKGIDAGASLEDMRAVVWDTHVYSGIEDQEGRTWTLREGALGAPIISGTQPPRALEPGLVEPISHHLAYYLTQSGATEEQIERLKEIDALPSGRLPRFSEQDTPEGIMSFLSYEKYVDIGLKVEEEKTVSGWLEEKHGEVKPTVTAKEEAGEGEPITPEHYLGIWREGLEGSADRFFRQQAEEGWGIISQEHNQAGQIYMVETPEWLQSEAAMRYFLEYRVRRTYATDIPYFRTALLFSDNQELITEFVQRDSEIDKHNSKGIDGAYYRLNWVRISLAPKKYMLEWSKESDFSSQWQQVFEDLKLGLEHTSGTDKTDILEHLFYYKEMADFLAQNADNRDDYDYQKYNSSISDLLEANRQYWTSDMYSAKELRSLPINNIRQISDLQGLFAGERNLPPLGKIGHYQIIFTRLEEEPESLVVAMSRFLTIEPNQRSMIDYEQLFPYLIKAAEYDFSLNDEIRRMLELQAAGYPVAFLGSASRIHKQYPIFQETIQEIVQNLADQERVSLLDLLNNDIRFIDAPYAERKETFQDMKIERIEALLRDHYMIHQREYYFEQKIHPAFSRRLRELYSQEADPEQRRRLLTLKIMEHVKDPIIPKNELNPIDLEYIKSIPWAIVFREPDSSYVRLKMLYDSDSLSSIDVLNNYEGYTIGPHGHTFQGLAKDKITTFIERLMVIDPNAAFKLYEELELDKVEETEE